MCSRIDANSVVDVRKIQSAAVKLIFDGNSNQNGGMETEEENLCCSYFF